MSGNIKSENCFKCQHGFTLLETLIVISLLSVLIGVTVQLLTMSFRIWSTAGMRTATREDICYAVEKTVRDIKQCSDSGLEQYNSIDHTVKYDDLSGNTYVLYLYNPSDTVLDSIYSQDTYDLLKANIDAGDLPALGEGIPVLRDLQSPDAASAVTSLSIGPGGSYVSLDIVVNRNDELVRVRTRVRPRNL